MSTSTPKRATNEAGSSQTFAGLPERLAQQFQDSVRKPGCLLIDGEWVEAASGKTFETLNPAAEEKIEGNTIPIPAVTSPGSEFLAYTRKEPVGIVGRIIPWNFPLLMAARGSTLNPRWDR